MRNIYGIILAGGIGRRFGSKQPKQFLLLQGKPVIQHSIERFRAWGLCKSLRIVCHKDWILEMESLVGHLLEGSDEIVEGGETRHDSVLASLKTLAFDDSDLILFHDAARPFFSVPDLESLVSSVLVYGSASLVSDVAETVIISNQGIANGFIPRETLALAKTPQAIRGDVLRRALSSEKEGAEPPTDLCSWMELIQEKTGLVNSKTWNLKITNQEDLRMAEALANQFNEL